ncbi:aldo/keto reductase [Streptomyces sp. NPDC050560]|uniref:aldo/keto reductase n=1 Tax=Streptomyces sp. NPDC050560 TaxID=3365630 RepID=UPI0037B1BDF8
MPARTAPDSLVLGTWGLAGRGGLPLDRSYGEVTEDAALETMDLAWAAGLRHLDTAPGYGAGEGLRRVGRWQADRGRTWHVAAKPGRPLTARGPASDLSPPGLLREIAHTAALTGPPAHILVKDPPPRSYTDGGLAGALHALDGRFPGARVGVAGHLPEALAEFAERPEGAAPPRGRIAQIELNAVNHRVARPAADRLAARGWEVWAMQPLAYGFLARADPPPASGRDWRSTLPPEARRALRAAARSFARGVGADRAPTGWTRGPVPQASWAIAFCLGIPSVTRTVIGPKNAAQLRDALLALELLSHPDAVERTHAWATGTPREAADTAR